jgi:hypothetical protein
MEWPLYEFPIILQAHICKAFFSETDKQANLQAYICMIFFSAPTSKPTSARPSRKPSTYKLTSGRPTT